MLERASELPETTADLVELQNYLNECRDVTIYNLKEKIHTAGENVLFLMQNALLSRKRYFVIESYK
jgi:dynein heavy chain